MINQGLVPPKTNKQTKKTPADFNFKETMTTLVNDTWNGVKDAIQAIERGENPNSVWNRVIIRTEQKDINTINKGLKRS